MSGVPNQTASDVVLDRYSILDQLVGSQNNDFAERIYRLHILNSEMKKIFQQARKYIDGQKYFSDLNPAQQGKFLTVLRIYAEDYRNKLEEAIEIQRLLDSSFRGFEVAAKQVANDMDDYLEKLQSKMVEKNLR